jgi:hypothetical protein
MLLAALLDIGVPHEFLEKMAKQTPVEVLGLEPGWAPPAAAPGPAATAGPPTPGWAGQPSQ